ncbi:Mucin-like protein (Fragment) [Geodia barretti]|uniref:Mucin-like protein n=1 Tax=Geodia barretti TaxID=519541 RepID=A0AA35SS85_GEOBA
MRYPLTSATSPKAVSLSVCNQSLVFFFLSLLHALTATVVEQFRQLGHLEEGCDYIKFPLLSTMLGLDGGFELPRHNGTNSTNGTENYLLYMSLLPYLDGASTPITHNGIGVGTTSHTNIYVGTNGIISFGRPFYFWYSRNFPTPYPWIRETYVAAPFWHDADIRSRGDVIYTTPSKDDYRSLYGVIDKFLSFQLNSSFTAEWILLASWVKVPVYPHHYYFQSDYVSSYTERILNDFNTFEAAIVSSGADTYAIYTYNCDLLTNPGPYYYRGPVIGYNLRGFEFENHRFSESQAATRVACGNWPSSDWFNLVYKISSGEDEKLRVRGQCLALLEGDGNRLTSVSVKNFKSRLSPCPCTIRQAWRDRNYRWDSENFYCYYRRFANTATGDYDQYCCYSFDFQGGTWGALIKSGYRASGMTEMVTTRFGRRTISERDVEMRRFCCGLAGLCDLFLQRRPPNDCIGYVPPVWTWAWGDPHIMTISGDQYTFNGYGEFVMLRYDNMVDFQARMRPTYNTNATQFSAFAFGYIDSDKVTIDCGSSEEFCVTWLNDMDISDNLTSVNDSYFSDSGKVEVVRETVTTVAVGLANGISLAVTYNQSVGIPSFQLNLDPGLSGTMMGLLGNKAGELVHSDGDPFSLTAASDQEIFEFGNSWLISTHAESLFRYAEDEGPMTYQNSEWAPTFTADIEAAASDEAKAACTPAGATQPVTQCLFDAVATGNISVGMATTNTLNENNLAMEESTNMPPVITSSVQGVLTLSHISPLTFTTTVTDDKDDTNLNVSLVSPPPGASLTQSASDPGSFLFHWQLTSSQEDQLSDVMIVATDSQGAANVFSPHVEICACQNGGTCTSQGATSISDLLVILNCICSPAWEGPYCEEDVDGCLEYACIDGVECFDAPAPGQGATCGPCPVGYTADGEKCADINECESESSCAQVCTNTEGSYECSCNRGYVVSDSDPTECVDFNECRTLVEHCEQICTNTDGSFTCSCQTGFRSDGPFCSPERQCNADYDECGSAFCANISSNAYCYCSEGFQLDTSGANCADIDECDRVGGPCHHFCTNIPGTYACSCREGYVLGLDLATCEDVDECRRAREDGERLCLVNEACINTEGAYDCVCAPGLIFIYDSIDSSFCGSLPASRVYKEEFMRTSINITFSQYTVGQLELEGRVATVLDLVKVSVVDHCTTRTCAVERLVEENDSAISKRNAHVSVFDPTKHIAQPVPRSQDPTQNVLTFYVDVEIDGESGALDEESTLAAIQNNIEYFEDEYGEGSVSFTLAYPSPPVTGEPPVTQDDDDEGEFDLNVAVVAGVTAAAAVVGVVSSVAVAIGLYFCVEWHRKRKNMIGNKRGLLTDGVSMPDGKGGGEREMREVPPQGPRLSEDLGRTVLFNEGTA